MTSNKKGVNFTKRRFFIVSGLCLLLVCLVFFTHYINVPDQLTGNEINTEETDSSIMLPVSTSEPASLVTKKNSFSTHKDVPSKTIEVYKSPQSNAYISISVDGANFLSSDVVAADGEEKNQYKKLPLLAFNVSAQGDTVRIINFTALIRGISTTLPVKVYLYEGLNPVASATTEPLTGIVHFTGMNYVIPKDAIKVFVIKSDVYAEKDGISYFSASLLKDAIYALDSKGLVVISSGIASGNIFSVRTRGPVFTLNSASITKTTTPFSNENLSTSSVQTLFDLTIQAVGGDIYFGTQAASTTFGFSIYKAGVKSDAPGSGVGTASSTSWSVPSSGVDTSVQNSAFRLAQNNSVTIPVSFVFEGRTVAGSLLPTASYAVGLESIKWSTTDGGVSNTSSFMAGQSAWRTSTVSLP